MYRYASLNESKQVCMYVCLGQVLLSQMKLPELVTFKIQDSAFKTFRSSLQGTEKAGSYFHAMLNWTASEGKNGEMRLYVCMYVCMYPKCMYASVD